MCERIKNKRTKRKKKREKSNNSQMPGIDLDQTNPSPWMDSFGSTPPERFDSTHLHRHVGAPYQNRD